jgi:excisionase family DNA binding protein
MKMIVKKGAEARPCRVPASRREQQQEEPAINMAAEIAERKTALTAAEVATLLACSYPHVCKMAKRGRIPSLRIGGMVRFDPVALSNWLQGRAVGQ